MIVLAVVAAVIAAILLIPIKIFADWRGSLRLWIKVLFFRFDVIPNRKKKKNEPYAAPTERVEREKPPTSPPRPERPKPEQEKQKSERKKTTTQEPKELKTEKPPASEKPPGPAAEADEAGETAGFVDKFLKYYEMASELFDPFRRALRKLIKINRLNVRVRVGTQDAANTAIFTGMLWGVAGNLLGLVTRFVTVEKPDIAIIPAYNETVLAAEGGCIIRTNLANIIGAVSIAAIAWLRYKCKKKKQNRRNKK